MMIDPVEQGETVEQRAARLGLSAPESAEERAARLGLTKPAPTGHAGKKFVDAPEMLQQHNGKPFVDAEPEPSYAQQALGGVAAIGRHVAGDAQAAVRSMVRDRGVLDFVKELGNTKGRDVLSAMKFGPLGVANLTSDALRRTPSYARAQEDIGRAEASNPASDANAVLGGGIGAATLFKGVEGGPRLGNAARGFANGSGIKGRLGGLVRGLGDTGVPIRPMPGLQSPMESAAANQTAPPGVGRGRPVATAFPQVGEAAGSEAADASGLSAADRETLLKMGVNPEKLTLAKARPPTSPSSLDAKLGELLAKAKSQNPISEQAGNQWTDAEEAMGRAPHQQQAIVDQMKRPQAPDVAAMIKARSKDPYAFSLADILRAASHLPPT